MESLDLHLHLARLLDGDRALQHLRGNLLDGLAITRCLLLLELQISLLLRLLPRFVDEPAHQDLLDPELFGHLRLLLMPHIVGQHDVIDLVRAELTPMAWLVPIARRLLPLLPRAELLLLQSLGITGLGRVLHIFPASFSLSLISNCCWLEIRLPVT